MGKADDKQEKESKADTDEATFYFDNKGGRGSGNYPVQAPGMLGRAMEHMQVGDYNMGEFDKQRAAAQARRGRRR